MFYGYCTKAKPTCWRIGKDRDTVILYGEVAGGMQPQLRTTFITAARYIGGVSVVRHQYYFLLPVLKSQKNVV